MVCVLVVNASTRISDDDIFLGIRETVGQPAESEVDNGKFNGRHHFDNLSDFF